MAGLRGAVMMQTSRFALIANALASFVVPYQIPAILVISERGTRGEFNIGQTLMARTMRPTLEALGIVHHTLTEESTLRFVGDSSIKQGYPHTKMGNERMVEIVRHYGSDHIFINSSADWGVSDPLAVPKTAQLMRERGIGDEHIGRVSYDNALKAFSAGGQMAEAHWLYPPAID
jgi:hypothetical protein